MCVCVCVCVCVKRLSLRRLGVPSVRARVGLPDPPTGPGGPWPPSSPGPISGSHCLDLSRLDPRPPPSRVSLRGPLRPPRTLPRSPSDGDPLSNCSLAPEARSVITEGADPTALPPRSQALGPAQERRELITFFPSPSFKGPERATASRGVGGGERRMWKEGWRGAPAAPTPKPASQPLPSGRKGAEAAPY